MGKIILPRLDLEAIEEYRKNRKPDLNSALYWLPRIQRNPVLPIPRTEIVHFDDRTIWPAIDGDPIPDAPVDELKAACETIGYPCFIRLDANSHKHGGISSCQVTRGMEQFINPFLRTFEFNAMIDREIFAFLVREWLTLKSTFSAFGDYDDDVGLPIAREYRVKANSLVCETKFFYWPEEAFESRSDSPDDWRERLEELRYPLSTEEDGLLSDYAILAAKECNVDLEEDHFWSVDFAQDIHGKWWLIDMADWGASWRPKGII